MKSLLYTLLFGFSCWMISEVFEIVQGGYSPPVYYLTAAYHLFGGIGIWGLYKKQTASNNMFNTISVSIASVSYIAITFFPIQVMNSGLTFAGFLELNPIYKLAGLVWFIGMVLFDISIIRTGYFPKWSGIIMLLGTVVLMATPLFGLPMLLVNVTNIIFAATVIYIGFKSLNAEPASTYQV